MPSTRRASDHVWGIYLPIAIGVFALVLGILLALLAVGSRRSRPGSRSQAPTLEIAYAAGLACVAAFLVWVTFRAETPIDRLVAHPTLRIRLVAAQWSWRFIYPNGVQVADINTWHPAPAYVPTGTEVEFIGTSEDVIHGFFVPRLHYQRQVLPGYSTHFDLTFENAGMYPGQCSVLCGENHTQMHFAVRAVSPARFQEWLAREGTRAREGLSAAGSHTAIRGGAA